MTLKKFFAHGRGAGCSRRGAAVPATGALAQGTPQERSDCTGDAFQFCGSVIPNVPQHRGVPEGQRQSAFAGLPVRIRADRALPPEARAFQLIRRS